MGVKFNARQVDNATERLICTGLIVSDSVLAQLAPILYADIMTAKYTSRLVEWCLDYYKQFGKAPGLHIQDIFESAKRDYLEEDSADLIESLLAGLSEEMSGHELNEQYVVEQGEQYIKARQAQILCEDALALLSKGQVLEAEGRIAAYSIPKRAAAEGDEVFTDSFWTEEEEQAEVLFRLPGALNDLVGPIERDSFISLLAPEKRGKTWWLLQFALTAFRQRCNVVFFSCGDMTKSQMRKRLRHMLTGRDPKRPRSVIQMPVLDCYHNQIGECPLGEETDPVLLSKGSKARRCGTFEDFPDHTTCDKCYNSKHDKENFFGSPWMREVKLEDVEKSLDSACEAITKRSGHKHFKLFCYPPASLTVAQIEAQLDILEQQEGFLPDVVFIDYADLLDVEPSARRLEYRHQINAGWMAMRKLSQVRRCALITATQAKLETRKKSQVDQWDTSEDKRKLAHVTAMLALNQTPAEKRQGIMRISNIAMRDDDFDVERNVVVLQCLALGKPYLVSYPHKVIRSAEPTRRSADE